MTALSSYILHGDLVLPDRIVANGFMTVTDHVITDINVTQPVSSDPVIDWTGHYIAPGLIDLQANGGGGMVFNDAASLADLHAIIEAHRQWGTTGFLATLMCDTPDHLERQIAFIADAIDTDPLCRAHLIGIHLEGPFFNPERRGMHNADLIIPPHPDWMARWIAAGRGQIKIVTLAPEMPDAIAMVTSLVAQDIRVALAHSNADYTIAMAAIAAGATLGTHLFNTMPPIQGRAPGLIGALLDSDRVSVGLINDGHHVHDASLRLALRAKGLDQCFFVSDSMHALNATQSLTYRGMTLEARDGACYNDQGTFAGSATPLLTALQRAVHHLGLSLPQAIRLTSTQPAQLVHATSYGALKIGKKDRFIIIDHDLNLISTIPTLR